MITNRLPKLKLLTILPLLALTVNLFAQVTIGSNIKPNPGSLLDLKESAPGTNNETASRGLALPRVNLTDKNNLFPMFETTPGSGLANNNYNSTSKKEAEDAVHTGLCVYHVDRCTMGGKGVYVWTGKEWEPLHTPVPFILETNQTYIDLPSGKDARPLTAQTLKLDWLGGASTSWTLAPSSVTLSEIPFIVNPLTPPVFTTSPVTITLLPDAMTDTEVTTPEPWASKESILTFINECGQTKKVTLNQTNYALQVNSQNNNSMLAYFLDGANRFNVRSNAAWTTALNDPNNAISATDPVIGTVNGRDLKNGSSASLQPDMFRFTNAASTKYYTSDITFMDTASVKRFNDITITLLNCNTNLDDPTMEQWAERAGFTPAQISGLASGSTLMDGGSNPVTMPNGIQLHKDQDGNVFLSGDFGATAGRWMLNNLAALNYAPSAPHSQGRTLEEGSGSNLSSALYIYPGRSAGSPFNNNKRLGILYSWDAATGGKGGSSGGEEIDDGENRTTNPPRIQGICPDGWHLPSDYEWTLLEQEIDANTSRYSNLEDINATITVGSGNYRGSHADAMKEICPAPAVRINTIVGSSNIISKDLIPGMNIMLAENSTSSYGIRAYFWTASGEGKQRAYYRYMDRNSTGVERRSIIRSETHSVRCKKD